jgi:hypothetical protein
MLLDGCTHMVINSLLFQFWFHFYFSSEFKSVYTFLCVTAIPFNATNNDEFQQMCEAMGQFGPSFQSPSQEHVRGPLLTEEYERTKSLVQEYDDEKLKNGCSIMTDAWSDRKRSIMNLVTNCAAGTTFLSSKKMSAVSHTSEVIFELVDKTIEEIGEDQVVTDNASNNMGAKKNYCL